MPKKHPQTKKTPVKPATTKERIQRFREAYGDTCNIVQAAKIAGITRDTHYKWMRKYPKYAEEFEKAQVLAADVV